MPDTYRPVIIEPEAAWADWPESVAATAKATVFHISRSELAEALTLLDELAADLDQRRRMVAELANAAD